MTSGGFDPRTGNRSANTFVCQQNSLHRQHFPKTTVEDELEHSSAVCTVRPDLLVEKKTARYKALKDIDRLTVGYAFTGSGVLKLTLLSKGELRGPVHSRSSYFYQIIFPHALKKGETYELEVECVMEDPARTMRPYYAPRFFHCAAYGTLRLALHFPGSRPQRVFYQEYGHSNPLNEPIEELFLSADGWVNREVPQIRQGMAYGITWAW